MKARTSNTLFFGALAVSAAALGLLAAPASASPAEPTVVVSEPAPATCVDGVCYTLPAGTFGEPMTLAPTLAPVDAVPLPADYLIRTVPFRPAGQSLGFVLSEDGNTNTFIGSVDRRTDSGVPNLLDDDARIPTNFEIEPVRSVAGFGLRSTF